MVAGDDTPFTAIEIGYVPSARLANCCGTVKLIWNSPAATKPAKSAGKVMSAMVTFTPLTAGTDASNSVELIKVVGVAWPLFVCGFLARSAAIEPAR